MNDCVFCKIIAGTEPADFVEKGRFHVAFRPRRPHTPGHVLFVPRAHTDDAAMMPEVSGLVMTAAARYVAELGEPANIITSIGAEASQTVFHLHVHVVPRGEGDGIRRAWPWRIRLSEGLGPGDVFPEEGYEELAAQLLRPGVGLPVKDLGDDSPGPH